MERYNNARASTIILGSSFIGVSSYLLFVYPGGAAVMGSMGALIMGLCIEETKRMSENASDHNQRNSDI